MPQLPQFPADHREAGGQHPESSKHCRPQFIALGSPGPGRGGTTVPSVGVIITHSPECLTLASGPRKGGQS